MKKYMRLIIIAVLIIAVLSAIIVPIVLLNRQESYDGENINGEDVSGSLNIRMWVGGCGEDWLWNVIDGFEKKYPKVKVDLDSSRERLVVFGEIVGDDVKQKYDLFFTDSVLYDYAQEKLEPLDDVYSYQWQGEDKKIIDKIQPMMSENFLLGDHRYMISSFITGYGFVYNTDYLAAEDVPLTTDQMLETCKRLKASSVTPIIFSGETGVNYWDQIYSTWYAQYEGLENYYAMLKGQVIKEDGRREFDVSTMYQQGALEAMTACENLLWLPNGYIDRQSTGYQYVAAQKNFYEGSAAMMVCGSWLTNEMGELYPDGPNSELRMMRTPVISAIRKHCDSIQDDNELAALVRAIDNGVDQLEGEGYSVSQEDYDRVKDARSLCYIGAEAMTGVVTKNARNKQLAKLFLKYLYSDEGIMLHAGANVGAVLPVVGYDFSAVLDENDAFKTSAIDILSESQIMFNTLKDAAFKPYCTATDMNIEKQFGSLSAADRVRAAVSFEAKKAKYTANDNREFYNELRLAGLID